jgi:uncharacterized protein (DUF58 family)
MLYPDFNDLVACKDFKSGLIHPSSRSVRSTVSGNHRSSFRGQGLEFDAVREYVPGDDIRNIDWRVTARTGSPHLKIFKEERERHIVICVDMNATMRFGTRKTFKSVQAAHIAALLGWSGISQQDRISICLFGDVPGGIQFLPPKRTKKSICEMLKALSTPPVEQHSVSLEKAVAHVAKVAHTGSLVYLISDFMEVDKSFQYEGSMSRLSKKCDVVFVGVNDPSDKSISAIGSVGFCVDESSKFYVNTESPEGRAAYMAKWDEHQNTLKEITSKLKISMIEMTTESDVSRDLILGLKKIAKRKKR